MNITDLQKMSAEDLKRMKADLVYERDCIDSLIERIKEEERSRKRVPEELREAAAELTARDGSKLH